MADCSPNALAEASKCFRCIPPGALRSAKTYLLCQLSIVCEEPPAPLFVLEGEELFIFPQGVNDAGGHYTVEISNDGIVGWNAADTFPWSAIVDAGSVFDLSGFFARVIETGNGTTYCGDSVPSNVLDLTGF